MCHCTRDCAHIRDSAHALLYSLHSRSPRRALGNIAKSRGGNITRALFTPAMAPIQQQSALIDRCEALASHAISR